MIKIKTEQLMKANELKNEIKELEWFISRAEKVWEGKIIRRESKYIFKSIAYGVIESEEFHMDTEIKNKVLDVLRNHLECLKEKFNNI